MRRQYHFRRTPHGYDAWDVHRLIERCRGLPVEDVAICDLPEVDTPYWFGADGSPMTVRIVATHARLIGEADLRHPIILAPDGLVMDGMHRVARALLEGRATVPAVRLPELPAPDYEGCTPDELPYGSAPLGDEG